MNKRLLVIAGCKIKDRFEYSSDRAGKRSKLLKTKIKICDTYL